MTVQNELLAIQGESFECALRKGGAKVIRLTSAPHGLKETGHFVPANVGIVGLQSSTHFNPVVHIVMEKLLNPHFS